MNGPYMGSSRIIGMFMIIVLLSLGTTDYAWGQSEPAVQHADKQFAIRLSEASIKQALKELEVASGVSIVFNEQYLPDRLLSGTFTGHAPETVLEKLLFGSSLRIVRTGDHQIVLAPKEEAKKPKLKTTDIVGVVRDREKGTALIGATVYSKATQQGVVTDQDGRFTLQEIPLTQRRTDTLIVQHVGYEPLAIPAISIQADQRIVAELGLHSVTMEEVRVTGERAKDGLAVESISQFTLLPRDLEWLPGGGDDTMIRALQLLPGISGGQDGRSELLIRGSTPLQHLFSLNGITLYNTHHLFGFSSAINEEVIGSLDLYKGGFPARYGGRISGVIEATGDPGNFDRFQASVGLNGLHAGGKVNIPLAGRGAIQAAFRRSFNELFETRFYKKLLNSSLSRTQDDDGFVYVSLPPDQLAFQDVYTNAHLQLDEQSALNATFYYSDDDFEYIYYDPSLNISNNVNDPLFVELDEQNGVNANTLGFSSSIDRRWNWGGSVKATFSYSRFSNAFNYFTSFSGDEYFERKDSYNRNNLRDYAFQLRTVIPLSNRFATDFGGWINDTRVAYSYLYEDNSDTFEEKALIRGGYAQLHMEVSPGVLVTPGIRATSYTLLEDIFIEPRLRIQYRLNSGIQLKAAYGTYYQFIDRLDHLDILDEASEFWALAQDEIQPTRSVHRIVGIRWEGPSRFIDVELFSNVLTGVSELGQHTEGNLLIEDGNKLFVDGSGIQQGFEVLLQQTAGPITGWASYAYTQSERQLNGRNQNDWYPTNQDFRHTASVVAQYAVGRWQWSLSWQLASGQPFTEIFEEIIPPSDGSSKTRDEDEYDRLLYSGPINGQRLQPGHRLDMAMKRSFLLKNVLLDVGVTVFNVYNYRSVWRRDYNQYAVPIESIEYLTPGITPTFTFRVSYL